MPPFWILRAWRPFGHVFGSGAAAFVTDFINPNGIDPTTHFPITTLNLTAFGRTWSAGEGTDGLGNPIFIPGGGSYSIDGDFAVQVLADPGEVIGQGGQLQITLTYNGHNEPSATYSATAGITNNSLSLLDVSSNSQIQNITKTFTYVTEIGSTTFFNVMNSGFAPQPDGGEGDSVMQLSMVFKPSPNARWTGLGKDDLWSDGNNWLGGIAPTAGASLLFPSSAQQQTNVNDLGFTFNSVTIQGGNYSFSGQPLTTIGTLDFQGGATELDCSATTAGPTTIEAGASLAIGAGATLNVLSSDPFTVNGNFSLLANSECDIGGDASVASTGQVNVAANAKCSLEANSTVNLSGKETFADGSVLTLYANSNLNLLANGTANLNGTATLNSYSNLNLLANTTLNSSGALTADSQSNLTVNFGAALQQQSGSNYYFYGTAKDGGLWNVATGANVYQYSGSVYEVAATLNNNGNWTLEGAANFASGSLWTIDASGNVLNSGHVTVGLALSQRGRFRGGST